MTAALHPARPRIALGGGLRGAAREGEAPRLADRAALPNLDTEDASGKFTAHVLAAAAEYERDLIGARTREGMQQRKAEGVHVGRPRTLPDEVRARISAQRASGLSLAKIADDLNAEGIRTAHGGRAWHASTVRAVLASA